MQSLFIGSILICLKKQIDFKPAGQETENTQHHHKG
jgi:hypothetical protein